MSKLLRILGKLELVFDHPPATPVQAQILGQTITASSALPLLPIFLSAVPPRDWPSWLRDSHWLWTGALNGPLDRKHLVQRRTEGRRYRTTQPARAVMRDGGKMVQVQILTYEALFGPDDSPWGMYRQLKHDDDLCPHDHCVNPLHWNPVQSPVRRQRTKYRIPVATAEQDMEELIELIEEYLAYDQSRNFDEFWDAHFSKALFTQDEVKAAIRTIGGNVQRKLLGEDPDGQRVA